MKTKSPLHIVTLFSLLIFILIGQAGGQGFVWCFGDDHSALEYASDKDCDPDFLPQKQDNHELAVLDLPLLDQDCGPCFDIPTTLDATSRHNFKRSDFSDTGELSVAVQTPALPILAHSLTLNLFPQHAARISQTILLQRTVVLLT